LGLQDRVKLLGYRNDVRDLLAAADIFVLPSKAEPFGMSAVEAMMSGLPVIGTLGPGLGTIVDSGVTGILVPPDDELALAEAIEKLAADSAQRNSLGKAGRERAVHHFSSDQMAEKIVGIYRDVLDNTTATGNIRR
jgi:glycosyltransferase involved in cell wall biosynthesis